VTQIFDFSAGDSPLLISVPHDGRHIPDDIANRMTDTGRAMPDTDWHVTELYSFATSIGASLISANLSRYVVDLNRSADDEILYPGQLATGLCPQHSFAGAALYREGAFDAAEQSQRVEHYWQPYHAKIREVLELNRERHGIALLWDAHSIPSVVPRLFAGQLPELNLGSFASTSCGADIESRVADVAHASGRSTVVNGRFKGGYITRHYGDPGSNLHALQLEIAQRAYMNEATGLLDARKTERLRADLNDMLRAFLSIRPAAAIAG